MTKSFRTLLLGAMLLASMAGALAAKPAPIKPFNAEYLATYMGTQANAVMTLAPAGANRWKYSLNIDNGLARLSQSTTFEDRNGEWRPLSGNDTSLVLFKKVKKDATYDWSKGEARWSGDVKPDRAGPVALQPGDLDAMLINLTIARDVAAGKPLNYRMVDDGRVKQMSYQPSGKEAITVDGKSQQASKFTRTDGEKQTLVWVVDGLPVPARILQRKNGKDEMDLRIKSLR
ncbi:DUF3108 domain-containing protein [Lysobacter sp. CFH 32150]|uniref:DUF3108 domain-containing protein n=1 Tax=Lysobacter sp. CFH 32150 TaxID=2927128 RepID=UPI001FA6ACE2|nr:DUF3108 domain-containing protein [Lysobacter sp. CFH 32150]MCI4568743.1 DUF3108 domain-containing protein [Lysobacter sp. CFH 32150]